MKIKNEEKDDIDKLIQLKSIDTLKEIDEMIKTHNQRMNVSHLRVIKGAETGRSKKEEKS